MKFGFVWRRCIASCGRIKTAVISLHINKTSFLQHNAKRDTPNMTFKNQFTTVFFGNICIYSKPQFQEVALCSAGGPTHTITHTRTSEHTHSAGVAIQL